MCYGRMELIWSTANTTIKAHSNSEFSMCFFYDYTQKRIWKLKDNQEGRLEYGTTELEN